eukprot:g15082.t1
MSVGRRKRPGDGRPDGPSPPKLTTRNKNRCLLGLTSVLLFDPSSLHVADAQQACEIFLTPTRVMTGELAEGARLTSYTNLRVGCKMFYRKEAATQVSTTGAATAAPQITRVDAPVYYKTCNQNWAHGSEFNGTTCVQFKCPQVCSWHDKHCLQRTGTEEHPYGTQAELAQKYGQKFAQTVAGVKRSEIIALHDMMMQEDTAGAKPSHDQYGYMWWGFDSSKYERVHLGLEHCHKAWDHEQQTERNDVCRCGVFSMYRAKDVNNRFEHDWPPHGKARTDDYLLMKHDEIQFASVPQRSESCASEEKKRQDWLAIFPDVGQPWRMPRFRDQWAGHEGSTGDDTRGVPGTEDRVYFSCDGFSLFPTQQTNREGVKPEAEWCREWISSATDGPAMFGHSLSHIIQHRFSHRFQEGPNGFSRETAQGEFREACRDQHDLYETYMVWTKKWAPEIRDHDVYR